MEFPELAITQSWEQEHRFDFNDSKGRGFVVIKQVFMAVGGPEHRGRHPSTWPTQIKGHVHAEGEAEVYEPITMHSENAGQISENLVGTVAIMSIEQHTPPGPTRPVDEPSYFVKFVASGELVVGGVRRV